MSPLGISPRPPREQSPRGLRTEGGIACDAYLKDQHRNPGGDSQGVRPGVGLHSSVT